MVRYRRLQIQWTQRVSRTRFLTSRGSRFRSCLIFDSEVAAPISFYPAIGEGEGAFRSRCGALVLEYLSDLGRQGWRLVQFVPDLAVRWPGFFVASRTYSVWPWGTVLLIHTEEEGRDHASENELRRLRRKTQYLSLVVGSVLGLIGITLLFLSLWILLAAVTRGYPGWIVLGLFVQIFPLFAFWAAWRLSSS